MIIDVSLGDNGGVLRCRCDNGEVLRFHAIWLRDNAPDAETRSPANGQRLMTINDIPPDVALGSARLEGSAVVLTFTDRQAEIHFDADWLTDHAYDRKPPQRPYWFAPHVETWDATLGTSLNTLEAGLNTLETSPNEAPGASLNETSGTGIPTGDFATVQSDDTARYRWLTALARYGVAKLEGGPIKSGALMEVAALFGYVRKTNYGTWFDVRTEINPVNLAFTSLGLQAHTDNPYRDPVPTMQILYCLENSATGGDSIVVDGFRAVERLHAEDPAAYAMLAGHCARFSYEGSRGVALHARRPMIETAPDGEVMTIRFNNRSAAALTDIAFDDMPGYYRAWRKLAEIIQDPAMEISFKLAPGDCFVVDNMRVLHARKGYSGEGRRWLQGCYPDRDGLYSTLAAFEKGQADAEI